MSNISEYRMRLSSYFYFRHWYDLPDTIKNKILFIKLKRTQQLVETYNKVKCDLVHNQLYEDAIKMRELEVERLEELIKMINIIDKQKN